MKLSRESSITKTNFEIKKVQLLKEQFAMYVKLCNTINATQVITQYFPKQEKHLYKINKIPQ